MAEIILVRHGQANSAATDEAGYDKLSDLGRQQARWLGAYFAANEPSFDRVISGTLNRQIDTAAEMGHKATQDTRLNEVRYFPTAQALEAQHNIPMPQSEGDYITHLPVLMDHWQRDQLTDIPESFAQFETRITDLLEELRVQGGRSLVVTSGGVIGIAIRHILSLDMTASSNVMLSIMNSSYHRLRHVHGRWSVSTFNATPHLDPPDRHHARTYV